jgi:SAM-dependent methyltransferase
MPVALSRFFEANKWVCRRYFQPRLYPVGHLTALDHWFARTVAHHRAGGSLLEFGCGQAFHLSRLLSSQFTRMSGTDIEDVQASAVPTGTVFRRCTTQSLPFDAEEFDVVVTRSVIEHLDDPVVTFRELSRVARPGALMLMNLPNKWDYVSIAARLSGPFKSWLLKHVVGQKRDDFPVFYRCNTRRRIRAVAQQSGWTVVGFRPLPSQPSYLSFLVPLYLLGAIYQFVISMLLIDMLQPSFVVLLQKAGTNDASRQAT